MIIQDLEIDIQGIGEVAGLSFHIVHKTALFYIYSANGYFEVFKRKNVAVCIDFEKREYAEDTRKEVYPKSKDFGLWAWTCKTKEDALRIAEDKIN